LACFGISLKAHKNNGRLDPLSAALAPQLTVSVTGLTILCKNYNHSSNLHLSRDDLWIQMKFTGLNAHDPISRPYDANAKAPLEDRVKESLEKVLRS